MKPPGTFSLLWHWRRAVLRFVAAMALLGLAMFVIYTVLEVPLAPWLRSFGLWPTLTGDWYGRLDAPDGRASFVYLEIRGEVLRISGDGGGGNAADIYGRARWCDESGRIWDYRVIGDPDNWRGTRFHLSTSRQFDSESGRSLGNVQGEWSGDEIRAVGDVYTHGPTATATATRDSAPAASPPLARYTLRRGTEADFLAACEGSRR
jgi:hypothetical protein